MLVPAVLYKEEIVKEMQKHFYTTNMMYVNGGMGNWVPDIQDVPEGWRFQYAIINNEGELLGYMEYWIDYHASKAYNFTLYSFNKSNVLVAKEAFTKMKELVETLHRIEWRAVGSNPACKGYDAFIKRYNGGKHVLKDAIRGIDGKYYDDVIYEVVNKNN